MASGPSGIGNGRRFRDNDRVLKRSIASLLTVLVVPVCLAAADVATLAAAHANPTLGPTAKMDKVPIHISNLTIELTSGIAAPVLAGQDPIGIFFSGTGKYVYRSVDAVEKPIVLFEAKKLGRDARKESDGSVTIRGDFTQLYLRSGGMELPALHGESVDLSLQQLFQKHRQHFAKARWAPASHLLLRQRLDAPHRPLPSPSSAGVTTPMCSIRSKRSRSASSH